MIETSLIKDLCNEQLIDCVRYSRVTGGDINAAYKLETPTEVLFLKVNDATTYPGMFKAEATGLDELRSASLFHIPQVKATGNYKSWQFLVMEWLEKTSIHTGFWQQFAHALAQLHKISQHQFGFHAPNYIGSLKQSNTLCNTWGEFYANDRILPLTQQLFDDGSFSKSDVQHAELLCKKLDHIFPAEAPSLLHGDLWAGNFMACTTAAGVRPCIYDPAVYYGHREMDIGMSLLFGGYDKSMYEYYNELFPLENGWQQRVTLTQLYPLLVHAILFGGGYVQQCRTVLSNWA